MAIIILKILLFILLSLLVLVFLACFVRIKITVGNTDRFYYKLHICGIKIKPEWFFARNNKKNDDKKNKKDKIKTKRQKAEKKASHKFGDKPEKKKKSIGQTLALISKIAVAAKKSLPKAFRFKLKYLNITVGSPEADKTAIAYGRIHWIIASVFALLDGYKGVFYGFYAKRSNIEINADFLSGKTKAEFELTISFFIWQLLFAGTRIGIAAIVQIIKNSSEDNTENDSALSEAEEILKNSAEHEK